MKFTPTPLPGLYILEPVMITDERGSFGRIFCVEEFKQHGLNPTVVQCNLSVNLKKGTLRGMHFQKKPHEEDKIVHCTKGAIYDVALDLREESPTYKQWFALVLSAENHKMLYIPKGFAHGFQSLLDHSEVFYQMSENYVPQSASGVRWDDPAFAINWPEDTRILSQKDLSYPDYTLQDLTV